MTVIKMVDSSDYLQPKCNMVEQGLWPNVKFVKMLNPSNHIMASGVHDLFRLCERGVLCNEQRLTNMPFYLLTR